MLPDRLKPLCVVAVNEYGPIHSSWVGHLNLTFYFHGIDQGTYGFNVSGTDAAGKAHTRTGFSLETKLSGSARNGVSVDAKLDIRFHGGVFVEDNKQASVHYVIMSEKNYFSMIAYAKSRAKQPVTHGTAYTLLSFNCVDFAYQVFQHSDLSPDDKDVDRYLDRRWWELVAAYSRLSSGAYRQANIHDTRKQLETARRGL